MHLQRDIVDAWCEWEECQALLTYGHAIVHPLLIRPWTRVALSGTNLQAMADGHDAAEFTHPKLDGRTRAGALILVPARATNQCRAASSPADPSGVTWESHFIQ